MEQKHIPIMRGAKQLVAKFGIDIDPSYDGEFVTIDLNDGVAIEQFAALARMFARYFPRSYADYQKAKIFISIQ